MTHFLDAGHGKYCYKGAPDGSFIEWVRNRDMAFKIEVQEPTMYDNIVGDSPINISLGQRVKYANQYKGESTFTSLHSNASTRKGWGDARGHTTFYNKKSAKSKLLATCISEQLDKYSELPSRGIKPTNWKGMFKGKWIKLPYLYVLGKTKMPATLVEVGFHDNVEDLIIMKRDSNEHARAVHLGHLEYDKRIKGL